MGHHTSKSGAAQRLKRYKQDTAIERQLQYDALTLEQKIVQQAIYDGKQHKRLLAQLEAQR